MIAAARATLTALASGAASINNNKYRPLTWCLTAPGSLLDYAAAHDSIETSSSTAYLEFRTLSDLMHFKASDREAQNNAIQVRCSVNHFASAGLTLSPLWLNELSLFVKPLGLGVFTTACIRARASGRLFKRSRVGRNLCNLSALRSCGFRPEKRSETSVRVPT
mmetsp:Transcript_1074/g.3433  ORF Transcript_1074/g.3433 Transcript_1074/m.3433 type:complete len:164 (-) Transcript_1074:654-1145(-)|eukprot:scaffold24393_cov112-Isochrysis_galbana.AAC.13